ncbi:arrestin domain-containing protein 1-like [Lytechinus pictus]|uniref:arrestin domain-containing protein 1-like n=1 Tax=Lytechinus pictus TaxID=7653 RepID=UPI0030B9C3A5
MALPTPYSLRVDILDIVFADDDEEDFRPGDVMQGFVRVVLQHKKSFSDIDIKIKGKSVTHWTKDDKSFSSTEYFFKDSWILYGEVQGDKSPKTLSPGEHRFPFQYRLPDAPLPPVIRKQSGEVSYNVRVKIHRLNDKPAHKVKRQFNIRRDLDLNVVENIMDPVMKESTQSLTSCCCHVGQVTVMVGIDKGGYATGEPIILSGQVEDEDDSTDRYDIHAALVQVTTFKSKESTLTTRDVMITSVMSGHVSCEPRRLSNQAIFLPRDLLPCAFQGCSNIALDYELEIKAYLGGSKPVASLIFPIIIGTIPVHRTLQRQPPPPPFSIRQLPMAYQPRPTDIEGQSASSNGLPPSYETVMKEKQLRPTSPSEDEKERLSVVSGSTPSSPLVQGDMKHYGVF